MRSLLLTLLVVVMAAASLQAQKQKINAGIAAAKVPTKYTEAIQLLEEGLKNTEGMKPKDIAKAWLELAKTYMNGDEGYQPLPNFRDPVRNAHPDYALKAYKAVQNARKADTEGAISADIATIYSQVAVSLYQLSYSAYSSKNGKMAVEAIDGAITIFEEQKSNENLFNASNLAAYSALMVPDTNACIRYLEKGVNVYKTLNKPEFRESAVQMYRTLAELAIFHSRDFDRAEKLLTESRQMFPESQELIETEVRLYTQPAMADKALPKIKAAYDANPTNEIVALIYANLLEKTDKTKALEIYAQVISLNPNRWEAYMNTGVIYYNNAANLNDEAASIEKKDPKKADEMRRQAMELLKKSEPFFAKVYAIDSNNYDAVSTLLNIYTYLNNEAKMNEMMEAKKRLGGNN